MSKLKIVEQTPIRLEFRMREASSFRRFLLGSSVICLTIAGVVLNFMGSRITLECQRLNRLDSKVTNCELTTHRLFSQHSTEINGLQRADLEEADDTDRVVLFTTSGKIPFNPTYTNFSFLSKRENVSKINRFVADASQTTLKVQEETRWFAIPFAAPFLLIGFGALFVQFPADCSFDKSTRKFYWRQVSGLRTYLGQYSLKDIKGIKISKRTDSDGETFHIFQLLIHSNDSVRLFYNWDRKPTFDPEEVTQILQNFLEVPLEVEEIQDKGHH